MSNAAIDNKGEREARNDLAICLKRKRTDGVGAETGRYLAACAEGGIKLAEVIHYQPGSRYVTGQAATLWTALSFHFTGNEPWHQVVGAVRNADHTTLGESPQPCVDALQKAELISAA